MKPIGKTLDFEKESSGCLYLAWPFLLLRPEVRASLDFWKSRLCACFLTMTSDYDNINKNDGNWMSLNWVEAEIYKYTVENRENIFMKS